MHAAIACRAHEMQAGAARACRMQSSSTRMPEELADGDHQVDAGDIHMDDAARADIQMPDFAVAHLAFRQPDVRSRSVNQSVGKSRSSLS